MARDRRSPAARMALIGLVSVLLLSGCTVRVVDPAERDQPNPSPGATQDAETSQGDGGPSDTPTAGDPSPDSAESPSPEHAAERERLIARATTTMPCPAGVLDQDGAIIRVEGPCAELVIDIDAGVVIADDVDQLTLRGSGTVVYAGTIGVVTVTGSADEVAWTGPTPVVEDTGTANVLRRG